MIMVLFFKRRKIGERLTGNILPAVLNISRAKTRGLQHLQVMQGDHYALEVRDNNNCLIRHVVKAYKHECSCEEWQHTGKPCPHALCVITAQPFRDVRMEDFVHHYYSEMFKNAYKRSIEPLDKRGVGRQRKKRFESCLEGGGSKKPSEETEKAKKMIRVPVTCPKCGLKGHRKNSPKCHLNGTKKRKRKPRKNTTKGWFAKEVSTSTMATNINELEANDIVSIRDSPTFIGEGTSSQVPAMVTSTPTKQATPKRAVQKITPKKANKA
ncbi:hypothetical protein QOZ80_3AG0224000 [Eleusine coracana subsp. coracana]|nr:hypothetical protein QOZ80_3AG0224000 [Eleusine coracana subsp. coracana]